SKVRAKCIEKIFHHNEHEYQRSISLLNNIDDLSVAELNVNTLLQIHRIPNDSKVAAKLFKALRSRFGITSVTDY
ncbi:MAG: hypothetical protein ABI778_12450, partial [Ignavibacteriota bacterium]